MKNDITLYHKKYLLPIKIDLPVSKSECNRALIISFISHGKVKVGNLSDSEDTRTLIDLIEKVNSRTGDELDCGLAGTTFRFLTAALSIREGKYFLTGNERMKQRPISGLVDALIEIGAEITYAEKTGFAPLKINGKNLSGGEISLDPSISSQFVSAMMMIAPEMKKGLKLNFTSRPVSFPYLKMTADMMKECGVETEFEEKGIRIAPLPYQKTILHCENDWSSASYFYSMTAVNPSLKMILPGLKPESRQGDSVIAEIYSRFGVETVFSEHEAEIFNNNDVYCDYFEYDFTDCPDLAQTLAFTCCALRISGKLTGLSTLKNKETDRIIALKNEMEKCGMKVEITDNSLQFSPENELPKTIGIKTYDDHRMAMAASVMALVSDSVTIENKKVVAKSFPGFWEECNHFFEMK